ncbi:glycosyltransferase family 4 protein [Pengzhenrongella sicca]|uniref:Glycosyltransferase family 4 protein n=1 Tax=Pengzhenrongella sicca TaxID=2819238 RepID=A0A8A4ZFF9_9MICO|nr:glycosyltransferase family 1 protein [Pengzhenrongella sicca]QTE29276.1 glycosyltransferase family 4 protein [Pengzhenrongella sicca]
MIIAIDATSIGSGLGGDETLARGLLRGLARAVRAGDQVLVLAAHGAELPREALVDPAFAVERVTRRPGAVHFTLTMPWWLFRLADRGLRPDVVVATTHAPVRSPAPVALLVTDLSFRHVPDAYPAATRARLRLLIGRQVTTAAAVLTISEFCRQDLIATYGLPPAAVTVVPLSVDEPSPVDPPVRADLRRRGVREPYLLYLGNLHPRKNVPRAIAAFRRLQREPDAALESLQLVVAGRAWFGSSAEASAAAGAPAGAVLFLDRVSDAEREALLRDAVGLVYLSTFEGFGLPPLEAMARDTPVLASTATAIPEVCGDGALLVDPRDDGAIVAGMRRLVADGDLRERLVRAGRARVAHYGPAATGAALYGALTAVAARGATTPRGAHSPRTRLAG